MNDEQTQSLNLKLNYLVMLTNVSIFTCLRCRTEFGMTLLLKLKHYLLEGFKIQTLLCLRRAFDNK